jgi:hypothetical protein
VRPVVALDIDGTLSDYHEHFITFACNYWGLERPPVMWDGSGEMEDFLQITKAQYRDAKLAYRQGGGKRVQPLQCDARHLHLAANGAELWLTTTRPWMRLDSTDPDTRWWLGINGLSYDHLLYDDNKYSALAAQVDPDRVVMVVDDLAEQCWAADRVFSPQVAYQVARPHNTYVDASFHRRLPAEELALIMEQRIRGWSDAYG